MTYGINGLTSSTAPAFSPPASPPAARASAAAAAEPPLLSPLARLQKSRITDLQHALVDPTHHQLNAYAPSSSTQNSLASLMESNLFFPLPNHNPRDHD